MFAGSTLFLDVGIQRDLWPGGAWPLLDAASAERVLALCTLARALGLRTGGVCCVHARPTPGRPVHCVAGTAGATRVAACMPARPLRIVTDEAGTSGPDRTHAVYLASGCDDAVATVPARATAFDRLTAGIRSAVVFGAGVELGIAHAVEALLARRVPTHLVIDASGAVEPAMAQRLLARWKRGGVDVLTTATVERLLRRASN